MKKNANLILWGICLGWALVFGTILFLNADLLVRQEFNLSNINVRKGRTAPVCPSLMFLGLDDGTINIHDIVWDEEELNSHPALKALARSRGAVPEREFFAFAIERLCEAGAKVVAIDITFESPQPGDEKLREVVSKYRDHVVLGALSYEREVSGFGSALKQKFPTETIVPLGDDDLKRSVCGFITFVPSQDGIVRTYRPQTSDPEWTNPTDKYDGMPRRVFAKAFPELKQPSGTRGIPFRFAGAPGTIPSKPIYEIFLPSLWEKNYNKGEVFRNKIIVIGPAAPIFHDLQTTPYENQMLGPELQLQVINAIIQNSFLSYSPVPVTLGIVCLAGLIAGLLNWLVRQPLVRFILAVLLAIGFIASTRIAYDFFDLYIIGFTPALTLLFGNITSLGYEIIRERVEKARFRSTLELYVSKNVANTILKDEESYKNTLGGVRKPVTILFSDIRGFTSMTESADEQELVTQLNEYFARMVDNCVLQEEGTLQKFIGDAIMAVWGDTHSDGVSVDACRALRAAQAMRGELVHLNTAWRAAGKQELRIGIGINHGTVVVGNIGSLKRREFTVIGDAVNLAARLEGATKEFKTDVLIGEETYPLVKEQFIIRTAGRIVVLGKMKPVTCYELIDEANARSPRFGADEVAVYEEAMQHYYGREFAFAIAAFDAFLVKYPDDYLAKRYRAAAGEFSTNPPGPEWNGVLEMTKK